MRKERGLVLLLLVLVGAMMGSVVGEAVKGLLPVLSTGAVIGINPPTTIDLSVVRFTLGFEARFSLASVGGILLALLFFRRS